jgi:hypothetical protein
MHARTCYMQGLGSIVFLLAVSYRRIVS